MIEVTKETYRESKKFGDASRREGEAISLVIQGHLMLVQRSDMGNRYHLLVTRTGVIRGLELDEEGERKYVSFEETTLLEPRTEMEVPRMCVEAADRWFAEGPQKMRELLSARESEVSKP